MEAAHRLTHLAEPVLAGLSRAGGWTLAAATAAGSALRPARKPLHPKGQVWAATLTRHGASAQSTGVGWLDEPGQQEATVRVSAAIGLPTALPDIHGLAIRVLQPKGEADILFATTGTRPGLRHVLRFTRSPTSSTHTTLLPYRSPSGPLLVAATPQGDRRFQLSYALGSGPWHAFADLDLTRRVEIEISFDPLLNPPAGLDNYGWVKRLREPAYRTARRSRG